jgi:hypothetical protein
MEEALRYPQDTTWMDADRLDSGGEGGMGDGSVLLSWA